MNSIFLEKEFNIFWRKIENKENFTLFRYGDGERSIMLGEAVTAQEGWVSPNYVSSLGYALLDSLNLENDNVYYGVSCPCCDRPAYYWYSSRIKNKNITFANLWVNINYQDFISKFEKLERDAILIANYRAKDKIIGKLNILKHYEIDDDCITFWENKAQSLIEKIKNEFGNRNDLLYVISAGPLSEPIITELYKNNSENCYLDFGSSIDKYIHDKQTRPYENSDSIYAKQNCWMHNPQTTIFDVSVVLNLYKRPQNLALQLEAIKKQTLKPKEILLYQDGTADTVQIPEEIKNNFSIIEISPINKGVWARFDFAKRKAHSEYICIFDDDTICGSSWLENCHSEMMKQEGLYGTIGILIDTPADYPFSNYFRVGWDGNLNKTVEVDLVGHSWFFKKEWLEHLFNAPCELQDLKFVAEDISFSFQLQKVNIKTFVPPHPQGQYELFGSIPDTAWKLGRSESSLSLNSANTQLMKDAVDFCIAHDWKLISNHSKTYYNNIKNTIKKQTESNKKTRFWINFICIFIPIKKWRKRLREKIKCCS